MSTWVVGACLLTYAAALFAVGWSAHRRNVSGGTMAPTITALSIGVYCTSWTFYGAVGTAARSGWEYLPIYLGPILAFTVGLSLIERTVALGKGHNAASLPDLLSRRFGRSARLAALATLSLAIVSIPYIALQLLAVSSTYAAVTGSSDARPVVLILATAGLLAGFGLVFGTRDRDSTSANPGLVGAIAFDSVFKLVAFLAVAFSALFVFSPEQGRAATPLSLGGEIVADRFVILTVLSGFMVLCLPRQFHMTVVEAVSAQSVRRAAPTVVAYLALFAFLVLPLVAAGRVLGDDVQPDLLVLGIPSSLGLEGLTLLAFAGGFAAAAGMIIVAGVALSTMMTSDVVLPLLSQQGGQKAFGYALLARRIMLVVLMLVAAAFALLVPEDAPLADLGVVAFAGAGQLIPLFLAALFAPRATEPAAFSALLTGMCAWLVFVLAPTFFPGTTIDFSQLSEAVLPFLSDAYTRGAVLSIGLNAAALAMLSVWASPPLKAREEAARFGALAGSFAVNGAVARKDLRALLIPILGEETTTELFMTHRHDDAAALAAPELLAEAEAKLSRVLGNASAHILLKQLLASGRVDPGDVMILVGDASRELRFGQELLSTTLDNLAEGVSVIDAEGRLVAWNKAYGELFEYPEGMLQVGTDVLDLMRHNRPDLGEEKLHKRLGLLLQGHPHTSETKLRDGRIVRLQGRPVPGGGYVTSFSDVTEYRESQAALAQSERATRFYTDNVPFPIAYCDLHQIVRFHNRAYAEMAGQPQKDLTGLPIDEIMGRDYAVRAPAIEAAMRGEGSRFVIGPAEIGGTVTWQVTYVPQHAADGSIRGFFGFYQDISQRRAAQKALEEANRTLEARVETRTAELRTANAEADFARQDAEAANRSKTRFLAAASHDVLQPLNAARLFASSLEDSLPESGDERETAEKISAAIVSADTLLRSLLNLSKLDAGGVDPKIAPLALGPFLAGIVAEFEPLAQKKGLNLRFVPTDLSTRTDAGLLRSALQNLISNALRYTDEGSVLVGVRRRGGEIALDVVDSGRGIAKHEVSRIFDEFSRLERDRDVDGAGLGLATVRRVASLLAHEVEVSSELGVGTVFRMRLPREAMGRPVAAAPRARPQDLSGKRVLCVDNDKAVLEALTGRFARWGAVVDGFSSLEGVEDHVFEGGETPDLLVLDYQLDDGVTGLDVLKHLREEKGLDSPAIFVTASPPSETETALAGVDAAVLQKPVEPAALRALSVSLLTTGMT